MGYSLGWNHPLIRSLPTSWLYRVSTGMACNGKEALKASQEAVQLYQDPLDGWWSKWFPQGSRNPPRQKWQNIYFVYFRLVKCIRIYCENWIWSIIFLGVTSCRYGKFEQACPPKTGILRPCIGVATPSDNESAPGPLCREVSSNKGLLAFNCMVFFVDIHPWWKNSWTTWDEWNL